MKKINADIVVAGSGIAGLYYALKCAAFSNVLIITKGKIGESNTMFAQGGIASVFGDDDSIESHIQDTLITGDGLCNKEAVNLVVSNARKCILDLERLHVNFDKANTGRFDLHKEGGHSHARVVHTADATGKEVENSLVKAVLYDKNITVLEDCFVVDLIVADNCCRGLIVLNNDAELTEIRSKLVMLATGGAGQIYSLNTNPKIATGDGFAMAYHAGAELMNMEFVQFHPTVLYSPNTDTFLITEALRGFGIELKNGYGDTFMDKVHPMKSLAPRDIVSRTIFGEMNKNGHEYVYLDTRGIDKTELRKHFPNILKTLEERGIDCKKQMIPVIPAAHYICGGIAVNLKSETSVENLFACGEVACTGLHGANRLASNSLLEGLVFAEQAAISSRSKIPHIKLSDKTFNHTKYKFTRSKNLELQNNKLQLQEQMWKNAGITRNSAGLNDCFDFLINLCETIKAEIKTDGISKESVELLNMTEVSIMVTSSALEREESRGCHFRADYPQKDTFPEGIRMSNVTKFRQEGLICHP